MTLNPDLKNEIEQLEKTYSQLEGRSVRRKLLSEIKQLVCHMYSLDRLISDGEPEFLSELLGREIEPEEILDYITASNLADTEFEKQIPELLQKHIDDEAASYLYIQVFSHAGMEALICDQDGDEKEVDALTQITFTRSASSL